MTVQEGTAHNELLFGEGRLWTNRTGGVLSVPPEQGNVFAPATHCLYEWTDYWLRYPAADGLLVGNSRTEPLDGDLFPVRFENQLGLTTIQPVFGGRPLCPPFRVEVISPKFASPGQHLAFFRTLLDDLFTRASRLPFTFSAQTARGVGESLQPPTPLFVLHFLCQYAAALEGAFGTVQAFPHRRLRDRESFVPLAQATEADADVLLSILRSPDEWAPARGFRLAEKLNGYAPRRVWQREPEETFDTPENRFVLAFLRDVLTAADSLPSQAWWVSVPATRRATVLGITGMLRQAVTHSMFDDVDAMYRFPSASQVVLRRHGYRELLELWQIFHQARRPLFEPLRQAIDVRDIATLYEMWTFFVLVEEIAAVVGESPVINLRLSDEKGLDRNAEAHFGSTGTLVYNRTFGRSKAGSYSVPLRPDFSWIRDGKLDLVLDAKFRLDRAVLEDHSEDTAQATAKRADLYKMHTYRDALGVRAAVSLYPGDVSVFYDRVTGKVQGFTLQDLLAGAWSGIGAIAMRPSRSKGVD